MKKSKNKTRIVLDSNIIISAAISPNSLSAQALRVAIDHYTICVSEETFSELAEVIQRAKFDKYFEANNYTRSDFLSILHPLCSFFEPTETITDCNDPKDNKFLEVSVAANAFMLVSGDKKHLLSMNPYRGIQIVTARDFITQN
jgi:putative PIN family toxin of toxin-antitoxin system